MRRNLSCSPHVHVVLELCIIWKTSVPFTLNMLMLLKVLETAALAGSADVSGEMKRVLAEKNQLQQELQRCLQETHQKDLHFQQVHSKVTTAGIPNTSCGSELIPAQKCCIIESQSDLKLRFFNTSLLAQARNYKLNVSIIFPSGFPDLLFDRERFVGTCILRRLNFEVKYFSL